ncbi:MULTISPECIES: LysE family transporter [Cyanophyceae]|uniref:LysE/ArgO family amino acid transporter n=1 Tax=Cyanophyceae TaxID=3028117 RepID=UPI0016887781|nr:MULTISPECIES: LysE family transporter [Cyanophyceae]MBD1915761.1 LysE family transporter [Phormidium sp. FACHB-77]MBD2030052.1 LysE family transporter [Phormidium sp. FACHB-322]MBD2052164.1 LysE family transporter [Leptolyngbya sp. FACHB-60]
MEGWTLLKGMGLGLAIAVPVGPIGLLCIRRSLTQGQLMGLVTGLGAATADGIYGSIAGFGLTAVANLLVRHTQAMQLIGGVFLCYLGFTTLRADPATEAAKVSSRGLWEAYASTLVLTLTNPATILSFIAIFAGLGLVSTSQSWGASLTLIMGVFLGSALWWLCLSWGVTLFSQKLTPSRLKWLNRLAGAAIFGFGAVAIALTFKG